MKELLEKAIYNYKNHVDEEGTFKTFCEIYEKTGNEEAEFYMGLMLYFGWGTEENLEKAYEIMKKLYDKDRRAREVIANMYIKGIYLEQDDKKAFELYTELVADGEDSTGDSTGWLGYCYRFGIGTEVDFKKAFELFKKAAELGNKNAYFYLANMYLYGRGVEKDSEKAFEYASKSVELGDKRSCFTLGYMYFYGDGTEVNKEKAIELYKAVVERDEYAQYVLGDIYLEGKAKDINIEENKEYGLELIIKSAGAGMQDARDKLESLVYSGEKYIIEKLKELVEAGKDISGYYSYLLGECYDYEYGVEKDMEKSFELYKSSVELGCDEACFRLGMAYLFGEGTEKNHEKAVEMFKRAVEWNEDAQFVLGMLYFGGKENGYDVEENKEYGLELIKKAAGAGHEEAIHKIEELEEKDNDSQLDKNINYFEKGVEEFKKENYEQAEKEFENDRKISLSENGSYKWKGNPYLAFMYYYGLGKKVDYEKAWKECVHEIMDFKGDCGEQVNDNIISHYLVGKMLNNGEGVKQDVDEALRQFKFIADEYKIKELIKEDYLFNIILNEYKETEAQYVYSLIYGPSVTK